MWECRTGYGGAGNAPDLGPARAVQPGATSLPPSCCRRQYNEVQQQQQQQARLTNAGRQCSLSRGATHERKDMRTMRHNDAFVVVGGATVVVYAIPPRPLHTLMVLPPYCLHPSHLPPPSVEPPVNVHAVPCVCVCVYSFMYLYFKALMR